MKNILLIEDNLEVQILVRSLLQKEYAIDIASTAAQARELLDKNIYDLFLLDIMLPDDDGFHLCAYIRNNENFKTSPILFLTAKADISDKVMGFALGADDYIQKPFNSLELKARIQAKLNRIDNIRAQSEHVVKGSLKLNTAAQKAFIIDGPVEKELDLTPNEFKLLNYFFKNEGHVLSREKLLHDLWGNKSNVLDRTVDTHVYQLRKKLAEKATYIESIVGEGYRFDIQNESLV